MSNISNVPQVKEIKNIKNESNTVKTFIFDWKLDSKSDYPLPGQFMMIWNFEDEKPMSLSLIDPIKEQIGFSIKKVGEFSTNIHTLKKGDKLGLRGPYGRGFELIGSNILVIGGGIGMAPISAFVDFALERGVKVDVITASQTLHEILFRERLQKAGAGVLSCTDDGTCGFKGFATDRLKALLQENSYDLIVSCGPELMMKAVLDLADQYQIPCQLALERWMKCALGLCGQCCVDDTGWRVCVEGPVFWGHELKLITEFGKYRRDSSGTPTSF